MDKLINFCPRCGHQLDRSVIIDDGLGYYKWVGNGGHWDCDNCKCVVEGYVLGNNPDYELKEEFKNE